MLTWCLVTKDQKKELKNAFRERADASGQVHKEFWVETAVEKGIVKELAEIIFNAFDKGGGHVPAFQALFNLLSLS